MSQAGPAGRSAPRWSVGSRPAPGAGPAARAGLPARSASVGVGPPLFCSGPSFGSATLAAQLASGREMLWPPSVIVALQATPEPAARMLSVAVTCTEGLDSTAPKE